MKALERPLLDQSYDSHRLLRQPGGFEGVGRIEVVPNANHPTIFQVVHGSQVHFDRHTAPLTARPLMYQRDNAVIGGVDQPLDIERQMVEVLCHVRMYSLTPSRPR